MTHKTHIECEWLNSNKGIQITYADHHSDLCPSFHLYSTNGFLPVSHRAVAKILEILRSCIVSRAEKRQHKEEN